MITKEDDSACSRVSLSMATKRRLWSDSAGFCQNPACKTRSLFDGDSDTDFAEMAHVVAASSGGPRDVGTEELGAAARAHHTNILVLCANCHTVADKNPTLYSKALLLTWKAGHRAKIEAALGAPLFETRLACREYVEPLFDRNRAIFTQYGPQVEPKTESRANLWRRHVRAVIIPNNLRLLTALSSNRRLMTPAEKASADEFAIHASELEARHVLGDTSVGSSQFPVSVANIYEEVE